VKEDQSSKIISVSILPQKYFTGMIAGNEYKINVLIPPGASPATYEPTPRQIADLKKSDLYLEVGEIGFEKIWLEKIKKMTGDMSFVDLSNGIEFIISSHIHGDHKHESEDPHIWMSPKNAKIISENIKIALSENFPSDSARFEDNYKELIKKINTVDSMYRSNSLKLRDKHFLIYHPALEYLARDYGMIQHVLEFEGKEPPPSHIAKLIADAEMHDIDFVFIQRQFSTENARSFAREIDADLIEIDPLNEDWYGEMVRILEVLTQ
jgi:zinc transport system substrate-binding protein